MNSFRGLRRHTLTKVIILSLYLKTAYIMPYLLPQTYKTAFFNYNFLLTLFCLPEPKRASKSVSWKAQAQAVLPISVSVA